MASTQNLSDGRMYEQKVIDAVELAISPERFRPYILRAGGSRLRAVWIYERNTAIAEALYGVTQGIEIAVRNSIHRELSGAFGAYWFEEFSFGETQDKMLTEAKGAIARDRRPVTPGAVVAELNLGFWVALLTRAYEKTLWVPCLHRAFPHAYVEKRGQTAVIQVKIDRCDIHERLDNIRYLRNRIAHHEPLLKLDLPQCYSRTLEALKWICPISAQWVRTTNCFPQRFHEKPLKYDPPKLAPEPSKPLPGRPSLVVGKG